MNYICKECGIQHDLSNRDGFILSIAHEHYEMRMRAKEVAERGTSQNDMEEAIRIVKWFEKPNDIKDFEWEFNREKYSPYTDIYNLYEENKKESV